MQTATLRHSASVAGLPADRNARLAARRSFVGLKQTFLHALDDVPGACWLLDRVRVAEEPMDFWQLRAQVFAVLAGTDPDFRHRRQRLHRGLDSVFPDLGPASGCLTL